MCIRDSTHTHTVNDRIYTVTDSVEWAFYRLLKILSPFVNKAIAKDTPYNKDRGGVTSEILPSHFWENDLIYICREEAF